VKRLSEAQRRVMTYLTHGGGNYITELNRTGRPIKYIVFEAGGERAVGGSVDARTLLALVDLGLVEQNDRNRFAPTATAWALAHKGELR